MPKATGKINRTHVLDPQARWELGVLAHIAAVKGKRQALWAKFALAREFGVHPKTVYHCMDRIDPTPGAF